MGVGCWDELLTLLHSPTELYLFLSKLQISVNPVTIKQPSGLEALDWWFGVCQSPVWCWALGLPEKSGPRRWPVTCPTVVTSLQTFGMARAASGVPHWWSMCNPFRCLDLVWIRVTS